MHLGLTARVLARCVFGFPDNPRSGFRLLPALVRMVYGVLSLLFFAPVPSLAAADKAVRADALGVDGIYSGRIGIQLDNGKGKEYDAPARLVFLPDGRNAILTAQHPDGVVSIVMRGQLRGRTFFAKSEGKQDYGGYHYGMTWDIAFDAKRRSATLHGKAINLPKWAHPDDLRFTFRKSNSR